MSTKEVFAARRETFKVGVSTVDTKARRAETSIQLRKNKRMESMRKRRFMDTKTESASEPVPAAATSVATAPGGAPASSATGATPGLPSTLSIDHLPKYVAACRSNVEGAMFEGTKAIRRLLSKTHDPPVAAVLRSGIMPRLVQFLRHPNQKLVFEAAWAITNIASTEHTRVVVELGATPLLVHLLRSPSADVREQCVWCLGNIAGDGHEFRDLVVGIPNAMENLLRNIRYPETLSLLQNATWTLSNFCRGKPGPNIDVIRRIMPVVAHLLKHQDADVLTDACWAASYLSDGQDERIQAVVDAGVLPMLVKLLRHKNPNVITPALRTVGNIVTGTDTQTQAAIDAGCLMPLVNLFKHEKNSICREAAWAVSNVAAGTKPQISALCQTPGMLTGLVSLLTKASWNVRKEAGWAVSNIATTGDATAVRSLVAAGVMAPLVAVIGVEDTNVILVGLDAIACILKTGPAPGSGQDFVQMLEECDGVEAIEVLQNHASESIYKKAVHIIKEYIGVDDEFDENAAPAEVGGKFAFGSSSTAITTTAGMGMPMSVPPPAAPAAGGFAPASGGFDFSGVSFS